MKELIVRCSSLGKLMAKPENADLDPDFVTDEVRAIIAKTKRADWEKAVLDEVRHKSLSAGGKTHVRELLREAVYGYEPGDLNTYPILKGREVEAECIALVSRLMGRPMVKNTERRNNGLIAGECDVFESELRHGRDIKAAYSMESMPVVLDDCFDSGYYYQMQGYMILWDADQWHVDYVLVDTPEELIGRTELPSHHYTSHIDEHYRVTTWTVKRDRAIEVIITDKVNAARKYFRLKMAEFDATHRPAGERIPAPWADANPPALAATKTTTPAAVMAPMF